MAANTGCSTAEGRVSFRTISPTPHPIPDDGPVGELLRATGRSVMRPGHLHARIEAAGFSTLTTMLFARTIRTSTTTRSSG